MIYISGIKKPPVLYSPTTPMMKIIRKEIYKNLEVIVVTYM